MLRGDGFQVTRIARRSPADPRTGRTIQVRRNRDRSRTLSSWSWALASSASPPCGTFARRSSRNSKRSAWRARVGRTGSPVATPGEGDFIVAQSIDLAQHDRRALIDGKPSSALRAVGEQLRQDRPASSPPDSAPRAPPYADRGTWSAR
jgi:hypothetical protein